MLALLAACAAPEPAPKQTPHRIVTLAPNVTEMVIALGAGDRIVGTDDYSADAMPTRKLPRVGGLQPNLEKIVAVRPDLVIANAAGLPPNLGRSLASVHIPLLVVTNERLADIAKSMTSIANALGINSTARRRQTKRQPRPTTPNAPAPAAPHARRLDRPPLRSRPQHLRRRPLHPLRRHQRRRSKRLALLLPRILRRPPPTSSSTPTTPSPPQPSKRSSPAPEQRT